MTATDEVFKRSDTRFHESLIHILGHISRRRAVERQIAAFGADQKVFARDAVLVREYLQRFADRALASLETIICCRVDNVDAKLHGANDCARVTYIRGFICVTEIRADTDR